MTYEVPWQPSEVSPAEEIIRSSAELPIISQELRGRVLEAAASAYANNRLLHRVQIVTLGFVCLSLMGLLGTYYAALFRVGAEMSSFAIDDASFTGSVPTSRSGTQAVDPTKYQTATNSVSAGAIEPVYPTPADAVKMGPIASAAASSDDWDLVEAFGALRNSNSDALRKVLWH